MWVVKGWVLVNEEYILMRLGEFNDRNEAFLTFDMWQEEGIFDKVTVSQ